MQLRCNICPMHLNIPSNTLESILSNSNSRIACVPTLVYTCKLHRPCPHGWRRPGSQIAWASATAARTSASCCRRPKPRKKTGDGHTKHGGPRANRGHYAKDKQVQLPNMNMFSYKNHWSPNYIHFLFVCTRKCYPTETIFLIMSLGRNLAICPKIVQRLQGLQWPWREIYDNI